jgi:fructose/tagatose bisphosphate aldolase
VLLTGSDLRAIFRWQCPFDVPGGQGGAGPGGRERRTAAEYAGAGQSGACQSDAGISSAGISSKGHRRTILAANANMPVEIFGRALVMAASAGDGSPIIIQLSHTALQTIGGSASTVPAIEGAQRFDVPDPLVSGATIAATLIDEFTEHYGAECVALSLDHFQAPSFNPGMSLAASRFASPNLARSLIRDASDASRDVLGEDAAPGDEIIRHYVDYLCSEHYAHFKTEFLAVVGAINPAWGMIDTERLPPLLDFVVTRDVARAVREDLGITDMMLEAEYGATGQSGKAIPYERLEGKALDRFADEVAAFVEYTGADGIAYPIGMEHAAKKGEEHEPDTLRLETVQRRILQRTGRYVPFAQHGGTGAAFLARGLVGKNNVNTRFLVTAASAFHNWVRDHGQDIRAGEKKASGNDMYARVVGEVARECVAKLEEAGTFGSGPDCLVAMVEEARTL